MATKDGRPPAGGGTASSGPQAPPDASRETMATDPKVRSLIMRTHASGRRTYAFRERVGGRTYKLSLGGNLTLDDARKAAKTISGEIARGVDPAEKRRREAEAARAKIEAARAAAARAKADFTVADMIELWAKARGERPQDDARSVRYVVAIRNGLRRTLAPVLNLPARELSADRIQQLIKAAHDRGEAAAARALVAIGLAFKRAIKDGPLDFNPCDKIAPHKLAARERTLTAIELRRVWIAAGTLPAPFGNWIRFLMATGVRRTEASEARWSEIEGELWHIPAVRMKAKRAFTVPLVGAALGALPPRAAGDFIFSTTEGARPIGGWTRIKADLDAAIEADGAGPLAPWRFHDFRRSLATWLSDREVDYVVADLCLGHAIPLGKVGQTYQRSYKIAERRQALAMWSAFLDPDSAAEAPKLRLVSA